MSELPITKLDYEKAVLLTDFIDRIKNSLNSNEPLKFTPLINGYRIDFEFSESKFTLLLDFNKKQKAELIVNVFVNEMAENAFKSLSTEDNDKIIKEILN
jgi:hypothetical protein